MGVYVLWLQLEAQASVTVHRSGLTWGRHRFVVIVKTMESRQLVHGSGFLKKKGIRQAHSCTFWGEAQEGSHYRARVNVRLHCTGYTEEQDALKKLKTEDEASQRVSSSHSH